MLITNARVLATVAFCAITRASSPCTCQSIERRPPRVGVVLTRKTIDVYSAAQVPQLKEPVLEIVVFGTVLGSFERGLPVGLWILQCKKGVAQSDYLSLLIR